MLIFSQDFFSKTFFGHRVLFWPCVGYLSGNAHAAIAISVASVHVAYAGSIFGEPATYMYLL